MCWATLLAAAAILALGLLTASGHEVLLFQVLDPAETGFRFDKAIVFEDVETGRELYVDPETVRADYLKTFNPGAVPDTPVLDELFKQSVVFRGTFAQSSWTKPCFATIFTGLYPEQHTATTKTAVLPDDIHTMPEVLEENGYYTAGFPNNPNVSEIFRFNQGFVEYNYMIRNYPLNYYGLIGQALQHMAYVNRFIPSLHHKPMPMLHSL